MIVFKELGKYGRFGNQLFQIASTIGIAVQSGQPFGFPRWINYDHKDRFGSTEEVEVFKFFENELPGVVDVPYEDRFIQWGYHDVRLPIGNYNLLGHMQSDNIFLHCINTVRHYLKIKDEYPDSDGCAIHVRMGDYQEGENVYHPRLGIDYYSKAIEHFSSDQQFFVFSDDIDATMKMFNGYYGDQKRFVYVSSDYLDSFKKMKACKHFICGNSSYSVMAAILSNQEGKKVICPKKWFGQVARINGDDCPPQNSIVI